MLKLVAAILLLFNATPKESPVVLEFFTSQKCAYCPAAEAYMEEVKRDAKIENKPILIFTFEVDWNKNSEFNTKLMNHQKSYNEKLNVDGPYTPQVFVNGISEFIGSDKISGKEKIEKALKEDKIKELSVTTKINCGTLSVKCKLKSDEEVKVVAVWKNDVIVNNRKYVNLVSDYYSFNENKFDVNINEMNKKNIYIFTQDKKTNTINSLTQIDSEDSS